MNVGGRFAAGFCNSPPAECCGALLAGPDSGLLADNRRRLMQAILGNDADDLRIDQLDAAIVRKDAADLGDALRARGFFPGRRVVVIEGATDGIARSIEKAANGITPEDAFLILTSEQLPKKSTLRKVFERSGDLAFVQIFPSTPDAAEIEGRLRQLGITADIEREALDHLSTLAGTMDHGSFGQSLEVIAIWCAGGVSKLSEKSVQQLVPIALDAEIDQLIAAVANGVPAGIGRVMSRVQANGSTPVSVLISLQRHFRMLLRAASSGSSPSQAVAGLRPPLWGNRRDAAVHQLQKWRIDQLEAANRLLFGADLRVRSSTPTPDFALLERLAIRLAIMAR